MPDRQEEGVKVSNRSKGWQTTVVHIPRPVEPRRFYVQLDDDDLVMLVIPRPFQPVLKDWLQIPLPRSMPLSECLYNADWVQVITVIVYGVG